MARLPTYALDNFKYNKARVGRRAPWLCGVELCQYTKMVANDTYAEQREDDIHGVDFFAQ